MNIPMKSFFPLLTLVLVFAVSGLRAQTPAVVASDWKVTLPSGAVQTSYVIDVNSFGFTSLKELRLFCNGASDNFFTMIGNFSSQTIEVRPVISPVTSGWSIADWNNQLLVNQERFSERYSQVHTH